MQLKVNDKVKWKLPYSGRILFAKITGFEGEDILITEEDGRETWVPERYIKDLEKI